MATLFLWLCGSYASHFAVALARPGNVIGVGDLAEDRLLLDVMSTVAAGEPWFCLKQAFTARVSATRWLILVA